MYCTRTGKVTENSPKYIQFVMLVIRVFNLIVAAWVMQTPVNILPTLHSAEMHRVIEIKLIKMHIYGC